MLVRSRWALCVQSDAATVCCSHSPKTQRESCQAPGLGSPEAHVHAGAQAKVAGSLGALPKVSLQQAQEPAAQALQPP